MANVWNKDPFTYTEDRRGFLEDLKRFHASRGTPFDRVPVIGGTEIDLYRLYRRVVDLGGWKKVNDLMLWDDILEEFKIPAACSNGAQALKFAYIRYLNLYEKVKFWGLNPEDIADGPSRKKVCLPLETIPLSYNYSQHRVIDAEREANKLSTDLAHVGSYEKLELSLRSGLANEVDFALNVCLVLSAQQRQGLVLNKAARLVSLLMAAVGIFEEGPASMEPVMTYNWNSGESKRDFSQFWLEVVKDEEIRKSIRIENDDTGKEETAGSEVLNLGRYMGLKDAEGQRVTQVAVLIRNLSFEDINQQLLASNRLVFRFLMLCVHCSYGSLRQLSLDTLSNLAAQMVLQSVEDTSTQLVMNLIQKSIVDEDKLVILRALEMLNKLCQLDANEPILNEFLEKGTYNRIVQLLVAPDIQLIVHTLEALYQLSAVGETTTTMIAHVRNAVDILVDLITVDVQSLGPAAQQGMRLVENQAEGGQVVDGQSSSQSPSCYIEAVPVAEMPAQTLEEIPAVKNATTPVEMTASNWFTNTYEIKADSSIPQAEVYADYQEMCKKFRMTRFLSLPDFRAIVRSALPQVCVAEVDKGGGGGKEGVFQGLCKRPQPKPFAVLTSSGNSSARPSLVPASVTHTLQSQPLTFSTSKSEVAQGCRTSSSVAAVCRTSTSVAASCQTASHVASSCQTASPVAAAWKTASPVAAGCQTTSPVAAGCQTESPVLPWKTVAASRQSVPIPAQQALKAAKQVNHYVQSASQQLGQESGAANKQAGAANKPSSCAQQRVASCSAVTRSLSMTTDTSKSSMVVPVSTSVTVSSPTPTSCTWITIPCSGQPLQSKVQRGGGKLVSRGEQTTDSSMVKTLLAQKVCQQRVCQANSTAPHASAHRSFSDCSTSTESASSAPQRTHSKLQQQQQQLPLHSQSPVQVHPQPQQQSQHLQALLARQLVGSGQNPVQIVHTQQVVGTHAPVAWQQSPAAQPKVDQHQPSLQQASTAPSQQPATLQQQSVAVQNLIQAMRQPRAPEILQQQPPVQPQWQSVPIQTSSPEPQASPQVQAAQYPQSSILKQLMAARQQVDTAQPPGLSFTAQGQQHALQPAGDTLRSTARKIGCSEASGGVEKGIGVSLAFGGVQGQGLMQQAVQSQGQGQVVQGQGQMVQGQFQVVQGQGQVVQGQGLVQQVVQGQGLVQQAVQGQGLVVQGQSQGQVIQGQDQVVQGQGPVQQVLQVRGGQQLVVRQPLQAQPQVHIQPRAPHSLQLQPGRILFQGNQPLHIGPQQKIIMQQGQPHLVLQGQSALRHILQQPMQQLHIQGQGQGQGQPVRLQQPVVIQLPMWPQVGASQVVSVGSSSAPSTAGPQSSEGGVVSYRAIVPRPMSVSSPSHIGQQADGSTPRPQAGQQVHLFQQKAVSIDSGVRHSAVQCSSQGRSPQQSVMIKTVDSAGRVIHSAVGLCQPAVSAVHGAVAQTVAPLQQLGTNGTRVSLSSVAAGPSTLASTCSFPSSLSMSSQQMATVQSSFTSFPSTQNSHMSGSNPALAHPPYSSHTSKYNGHVNGTKLHLAISKDLGCNGVSEDHTDDAVLVGKDKVNGVLGSPSSDCGDLPSPLMSLRVKKEYVNGFVERCVPHLPDSVTGCSKEWLQNLAQKTGPVKDVFREDSPLSQDSLNTDDLPSLRDHVRMDTAPNGMDAVQKCSVWQRNGLILHSGVKDAPPASVSQWDHRQTVMKQSSLDEVSLDSTDSTFVMHNGGRQRFLASPDGSYDGDRSCDSHASSIAESAVNEKQGGQGFHFLPTTASTATSPSPPSSVSSSEGPSSKTVGKGMKRKATPKPKKQEKPVSKNKKPKMSGEMKSVGVDTPSLPVSSTHMVMEYMCEWAGCGKCFASAQLVFVHVTKTHVPPLSESFCRWQGCPLLRRKRWSLVTHVQDKHCSEAVQREACRRRFLMHCNAIIPQPSQGMPMVYPEDAAMQAILRFQAKPPFVEFSDKKEDPLTKHIRLTSALTLRNIARYSALGRRLIRGKEQQLSVAAMSAVESSGALASCLWELLYSC
ncbi:uncharacterized protein LOC143297742 [Babylonia areolata]|uniref:uncharacterized protein LOC143297742 n=1 Tax=Babylonia areolata TaxID=304850 RepID=UPI003FD4B2FA